MIQNRRGLTNDRGDLVYRASIKLDLDDCLVEILFDTSTLSCGNAVCNDYLVRREQASDAVTIAILVEMLTGTHWSTYLLSFYEI
jgi:hypothetical protein